MASLRDSWTVQRDGKRVRTSRYGIGRRWVVQWREGGRESPSRTRSFVTKDAARAFKADLEQKQHTGAYVPQGRAVVTVGEMFERWISTKARLKPTTLHAYRSTWNAQVAPRWEYVPVQQVTAAAVSEWLPTLTRPEVRNDPDSNRVPLSGSQTRHCAIILKAVLSHAVSSGTIQRNPLTELAMPRPATASKTPLTDDELRRVIEGMSPYQLETRLLAQTGIRWGEMVGLLVGDVDATRRRLLVHRGYVEVGGKEIVQEVKSGRRREVPIGSALAADLTEAGRGRKDDAPLFLGPRGTRWTRAMWDARWRDALNEAGLPRMGAHTLRHTAVSLAIRAGADVKVLQRMLGHASAAMTLDVYGHLYDASLDTVGDAMARLLDGE